MQPSSVDVRVDRRFRVFHNARYPFIDVRQPMEDLTELVEVAEDEPFILHPGEFVLGQTLERVRLPDDLVARLEGKSSSGRLGPADPLAPRASSTPGFEGNLTLELSNVANLPITIYYGMPIGQISFMRMDGPVERPYGSGEAGSKYQGQAEPTPEPLLPELRALARPPRRPASVRLWLGVPFCDASNIGPLEVLVVLIIALIIFGPKRLPELGRSMGKGIREFRARSRATTTTTSRRRSPPSSRARRSPPSRSRARSSPTSAPEPCRACGQRSSTTS